METAAIVIGCLGVTIFLAALIHDIRTELKRRKGD